MQKHYAEMNQRMDSRAAQADRETKISSTPNSNGKRERTDHCAPVRAEAYRIAAEKKATLLEHGCGDEGVEEHLKKRKEQLTAFISKLCLTTSLQGLDFDGIGSLYHVVVEKEMKIPCLTSDEQLKLFKALEEWCSALGQQHRNESDPTDDYYLYAAGGEFHTYYTGRHWTSGVFDLCAGVWLDVEEGKQYNLWCEGCEKICNSTELCFEEYTTTRGDTYPAVYLCEDCKDSDIVNTSWCNCLTRDSESLGMICSSQKGRGLICDKCDAADSSDTAVQHPATAAQQPATAVGYTQFHNPILCMMKMAAEGTNIDASLL